MRTLVAGLTAAALLTPMSPAVTDGGVHRLSSGCFRGSYSDGFATTTLYLRNACRSRKARPVRVHWRGGADETLKVRGHAKTSTRRFHGTAPTIEDLG